MSFKLSLSMGGERCNLCNCCFGAAKDEGCQRKHLSPDEGDERWEA